MFAYALLSHFMDSVQSLMNEFVNQFTTIQKDNVSQSIWHVVFGSFMLCVKQSLLQYRIALYVKSCTSTRATLSALSHGGRISQRGDTTSTKELRCVIPQVEDLALERSCVSHDAWRHGKVGDIASQGKCTTQKGTAQWGIRNISRLEEMRDEEIARREQKVVRRAEKETSQLGELQAASRIAIEPGPRHLSPWPTHQSHFG